VLVCVCPFVHLCVYADAFGKLIPLDIDHPVSLLVYCIYACVCVCVSVCVCMSVYVFMCVSEAG